MNLFAYGTLMFPEVGKRILDKPLDGQPALLRGYAIYRIHDALFPGIIRASASDEVSGVIYSDLDEATMFELDAYESDFYRREEVVVRTEDGTELTCQAYVVPEAHRDALTEQPWDAQWFKQHALSDYLGGQ